MHWRKSYHANLPSQTVGVDVAGSIANPQYICRKCFLMYERFLTIREEILQKLEFAISRMTESAESDDVPPTLGGKRKCGDSGKERGPQPSKRPRFDPTGSSSPGVVVGAH